MIITLKKRIAQALQSDLAEIQETLDYEKSDDKWRDFDVDLKKLTKNECARLMKVFETCRIQGTKVLAADVQKFMRAEKDGLDNIRARTVRQAAWMLEHFFAGLKHHIIFSPDEYEGGSYVGYFVNDVDFTPAEKERGRRMTPDKVEIELVYTRNDSRKKTSVTLYAEDVYNQTAIGILKKAGYVPENDVLMKKLEKETVRYYKVCGLIGKKYIGKGIADLDLDDASESKSRGYSMWNRRDSIRLDNFDVHTPLVIDVQHETDSKNDDRDSDAHVHLYRWHKWNLRFFTPAEDELARHLAADEDTEFAPDIQIPVHPLVPCFDLRRHQRLSVHVNNLRRYKYRRSVAKGLVLPKRDWRLIDMLVDHSSNVFQDVVEGKGQSMNVLSSGAPGTGKTLTAEVFAEFKKRPLYNIQCSQLGLDAESIEKNLTVILQRANRWNAVLLLDEADVYIRKRGTDMEHNAVVGVFLRVLEYASCILFMTTNLPDQVDDAIASRCIVHIKYTVPRMKAQAQIWRNLANLNNIELSDEEIAAFIKLHPRISGRDVKNLLKLASFIAHAEKRPLDSTALEFALDYKPTADHHDEAEEV